VDDQLETDWSEDLISLDQISERFARAQRSAPFESLLLSFKYPVLGHRRFLRPIDESVLMRTPPCLLPQMSN